MGASRWTEREKQLLEPALDAMMAGASIYGQIIKLQEGELRTRSWDGIRRQLAEGIKARKAKQRKEIAGVQ